jgi:geranylgeranyl diphosphate synthase type I
MNENIFLNYKNDVNKAISEYLENKAKEAYEFYTDVGIIFDELRNFAVRGGKRLRAIFIIVGYMLDNKEVDKDIVSIASTIEHFQNWMLIHDDIIDNGLVRRNGDTLHIALAKRFKEYSEKFPNLAANIAIVVGDIIESYIIDLLTKSGADNDTKIKFLKEYGRMEEYTAMGQILDILLSTKPLSEVSEEDVIKIIQYKTAYYTIAIPLKMGAILGGMNNTQTNALESFGINVGVAFQILDDMFGAGYYTNEQTDKFANDLIEGKKTLLVLRALSKSNKEDQEFLKKAYSLPTRDIETAKKIKNIFDKYDIMNEMEGLITNYNNMALKSIESFSKEQKEMLKKVIELSTKRKY